MLNTMRVIVALFLCLLFGCQASSPVPPAIKINTIEISADEFESAFKKSPFSSKDTPEARKEFLDSFITKKLILREAEKQGLDKDPAFLKNVESFWQQSLMKLMLEKKIKELSLNIRVEDSEIKNYYNERKETDFKDKELPMVYNNIRWLILNQKQKEVVDSWLDSLKKNAAVDVNYDLLKIKK